MLALMGVEELKKGMYTLPAPPPGPDMELPIDPTRDWRPRWDSPLDMHYNAAYLKHARESIVAYEHGAGEEEVSVFMIALDCS
jgi:hypothetical protein